MKKRKSSDAERVAGISLIVYWLDKLSDAVYNALINGFFGYIFTAYSDELSACRNGFIASYFKCGSKTRRYFRRIREYMSESFETSFILRKLRKGVCGLADVPVKTYGSFFLSFGIYTVLVYFLKMLIPILGEAELDYLLIGLGICIITLPMHFSKYTLAQAVKGSRITRAIFVDCFGYRDEAFEIKNKSIGRRSGPSVLFGLAAGMLTVIAPPLGIIFAMLIFLAVTLIIISPEIGVLLTLFLLPFFSFFENPAMLLAALVLVTAFSYVIKLVRGKRIIKMGLVELATLVFLVLVYFSGAITVGGKSSYYSALISCALMLGYFLIVNLIRTKKWLHRCILALISSGTVLAVIGVLQYAMGAAVDGWLDKTYFSDIYGRATSLFENPNYLAAYLAAVFPFTLYQTCVCKSRKERLLSLFSCLSIAACIVLTWCRGAWLAVIICTVIFFMLLTRKTLRYIVCAAFAAPFLSFVLPSNVVTRFMSIGDTADSSTMYRLYTWKGTLGMVKDYFWGGIGYGTAAYGELYPLYAYAGIEAAVHSHSLYLQILVGMGIGGLVCFAAVILFYAQNSLEYLKAPSDKDSRLITAAALVAVTSILIMGIFDYVWYNYRVFFLFWSILALGGACIRIGKRELARAATTLESDDRTTSLDVELQ